LASLALIVFLAFPALTGIRAVRNRSVLWCLAGVTAFVPFLIWWDPFEPKWLLVPNMFITLGAACFWTHTGQIFSERAAWLAATAALILATATVSMYGVPEHARLKRDYRVGDCVGRRLEPNDLFIAMDWRYGDYMSYKYRRDSIDLISTVVSRNFDK